MERVLFMIISSLGIVVIVLRYTYYKQLIKNALMTIKVGSEILLELHSMDGVSPVLSPWFSKDTKLQTNTIQSDATFFSCDQAALQMVFSVRLSVCPSHLSDYVPIIV